MRRHYQQVMYLRLVDYAGPLNDAMAKAGMLVSGGDHGITKLTVDEGAIEVPKDGVPATDNIALEGARKAIMDCVQASCSVPLSQALDIQAKHSGGFMLNKLCQKGAIGSSARKIMNI